MVQENSPLDVGVIGGGVAGLSAAIALKRAGHNIEVGSRRHLFMESVYPLALLTCCYQALREDWLCE